MDKADTILYALLAGILPALVWLTFWLREDRKHPEPRSLVARTFLLGMAAVIVVLPFQKFVISYLPETSIITLLLWVLSEEIAKFGAAFLGGLKSFEDNEPIDPIIYMIAAALGFVALENTLFISGPIAGNDIVTGIVTGNLRFIGASLLHIVSSGIIGIALAFSFYQSKKKQIIYTLSGFALAVGIHLIFNLFLVRWIHLGVSFAFALVWTGTILLMLIFEKVKTIARQKKRDIINP